MNNQNLNNLSLVDGFNRENTRKRSVYLECGEPFYQSSSENPVAKVAPYNGPGDPVRAFEQTKDINSVLYDTIKPMIMLLRIVGLFPIAQQGNSFQVKLLVLTVGFKIHCCSKIL